MAFIEYVTGEAGDWSSGRYLRDDDKAENRSKKRGLSWNARTNPWTTKLALQLRSILYRKREVADGHLVLHEGSFQTNAKSSSMTSYSDLGSFSSFSHSESMMSRLKTYGTTMMILRLIVSQ